MCSFRKVARELLPLVVLVWATLAILSGALNAVEHGVADDKAPAAMTVMELCAITVALLLGTGAKRLLGAPRPHTRCARGREGFRAMRPVAYEKPPSVAPSPALLQILRT
jgi:hypothetical protein